MFCQVALFSAALVVSLGQAARISVLSLLLFAPLVVAPLPAQDINRQDFSVIDGDTIRVEGRVYRLDGIDAPEFDQACLDRDGAVFSCGSMAAGALKEIIGEKVHCEDLGEDSRYKSRRIGRCFAADGSDVNRSLVQQGWALNFEPYAKGRFKADEDEAREERRGIWKGCFVAPEDFRRWKKANATLVGASCPAAVARDKLFPDDPQMPPGCEIKGKYSLRAWPYLGIYHLQGCGSYRRTTKPDRWFCSEEDAWAGQFRSSLTCWWR